MDTASRLRVSRFSVACAVTALVCPPIERLSQRVGIMDTPNGRSSHVVPTPRSGGLACAAGIIAADLVHHRWNRHAGYARTATFALSALGLVDDVVKLAPRPRLLAQITVGAAYGVATSGARGALLGAVIVPASVNATNFMDGINGITAATVVTWSVNHRIQHPDSPNYRAGGASPSAVAGAALGFLPFNVPSARLFLGDSGSYLFGAAMGTSLLADLTDRSRPGLLRLAAAHAPLLVYAADTGSTITRRALRGASLTQAHREHLYQRIQARGPYSHWLVSAGYVGAHALAAVLLAMGSGVRDSRVG